jgi:hypothetical protein
MKKQTLSGSGEAFRPEKLLAFLSSDVVSIGRSPRPLEDH